MSDQEIAWRDRLDDIIEDVLEHGWDYRDEITQNLKTRIGDMVAELLACGDLSDEDET